ncbi:site-specific integrase [Oceanobacillus kimchii]|uniref:site-specific integrase n=1 Tax=Oceanobacillus kimchii TaxID=746691 RepID=UPI0021A36E68|nr:site-specific integrase [Oceanobacillus kimchii]MCT1576183.1 site-specific integrase [Oceanobacillus kimchii]MCT2135820.1 site-specific integrase [Oceanobacillus kimchii]
MRFAENPLGKISKNPCVGAVIPKRQSRKKKGELKYIESDQIATFLKVARQDNYNHWIFFKTLIFTGMRKGEAAALKWKDVDFDKKTISINKSLDFQPLEEADLFGDTNTYESERNIKISDELIEELKTHKQYINQNRAIFEDGYLKDLNLVFCRQDGSPLPKSTLFNAFNRILKNAEIEKLPIHSTRHTHAVLLLESGASMKFIQKRLGHKIMAVTSDTYSHISDKLENEAMDNFTNYMEKMTTKTDKN